MQSALADIIAGNIATAVGPPTFTADRGYAGNGYSTYINDQLQSIHEGRVYSEQCALFCDTHITAKAGHAIPVAHYPVAFLRSAIQYYRINKPV